MTITRNWEIQLAAAVRAFLDHYWENEYVDTDGELAEWNETLDKLTARLSVRLHDEWLTLRVKKAKQDHADAGHREEAMAEADYKGDPV